jgi:hypothetical protein
MDMYQSEKNLLEKLADAVPGLKGYRDKEARRDTDKRFREYLGSRVDRVRGDLDDVKRTLVNDGILDGLDDLDRLSQKLFKAANLIRHASYGYSGFFDQLKIKETELDKIYQYDLSLLSDVENLEKQIEEYPGKPLEEAMKIWEKSIDAFERRIEDRKNLFVGS